MDRRELVELLGRATDDGTIGAIEDHIEALATDTSLPRLAIAMCTLRYEEAAVSLRDLLVRAADGHELSDAEATLLFRGLHIMGGARDPVACAPLLRLLRHPEPELDALLGTAITETLARIVCGVFDDEVDALFNLIEDRSVDGFVRAALLGAATFLTWDGQIPMERTRAMLQHFYDERLAGDGDHAWVGWLTTIALLGLSDLTPLVHHAFDDRRIDEEFLDRGDFEHDLAAAIAAPEDVSRFETAGLGYIEDVLEALERTDGGVDDPDDLEDWAALPPPPTINPWRDVGRNDPCPCGSGKKFKHCHLK